MSEPLRLLEPSGAAQPLVVDSPHSGLELPADFGTSAPLDALRTTWDAFVDELWADTPALGGTLLCARFPRAYLDVNRAADDIDETLLDAPWPVPLSPTDYTRRGMGLIRRHALPDVPMYDRRLTVAEVEARIARYYRPYRAAVGEYLDAAVTQFGWVLHINCHSMKSRGNAMNVDNGATRPDFVISDRHGATADPTFAEHAVSWLQARGYTAQRNVPYQGGDLVRSFGRPATGRHSIQVEINRALYMDEGAFARGPRFAEVRALCAALATELLARRASAVSA